MLHMYITTHSPVYYYYSFPAVLSHSCVHSEFLGGSKFYHPIDMEYRMCAVLTPVHSLACSNPVFFYGFQWFIDFFHGFFSVHIHRLGLIEDVTIPDT